jgi:hypothetical protein
LRLLQIHFTAASRRELHGLQMNDAVSQRSGDSIGPVTHVQLAENVLQAILYRVHAV